MRIRRLFISVSFSQLLRVMDEIFQSWPSISLSDEAFVSVCEALIAEDLDDALSKTALAKCTLDQDRASSSHGKTPNYEIGWKNGTSFVRLTCAGKNDRAVTLLGRKTYEGPAWAEIVVDFGLAGSHVEAMSLLEALEPLEPSLKTILAYTTVGQIQRDEEGSVIKAALKLFGQNIAGHITFFRPERRIGYIRAFSPSGTHWEDYFFHIRNVHTSVEAKLRELGSDAPFRHDPGIPVTFDDGGKLPGKKNRQAVSVSFAD